MRGLEVKKKIDANNKRLMELIKPNEWNLNNQIYQIMKENELLQEGCEHQFENRVCIYCYMEEEDWKY